MSVTVYNVIGVKRFLIANQPVSLSPRGWQPIGGVTIREIRSCHSKLRKEDSNTYDSYIPYKHSARGTHGSELLQVLGVNRSDASRTSYQSFGYIVCHCSVVGRIYNNVFLASTFRTCVIVPRMKFFRRNPLRG